jgi:hypothetical protein
LVSQEAAGGLAKNGSVLAASGEGYLNVSQKLQNAQRISHGVWPLRA